MKTSELVVDMMYQLSGIAYAVLFVVSVIAALTYFSPMQTFF